MIYSGMEEQGERRERLISGAEMGKDIDKKEQKQDSTARKSVTMVYLTCAFFHFPPASYTGVPDLPSPPPLASDRKCHMSDVSEVLLVLQDNLLLHKQHCFGQEARAGTLP